MENGIMVREVVMELIFLLLGRDTRVIGKRIKDMDLVRIFM